MFGGTGQSATDEYLSKYMNDFIFCGILNELSKNIDKLPPRVIRPQSDVKLFCVTKILKGFSRCKTEKRSKSSHLSSWIQLGIFDL